ncbi:juvenile hormone epoxide hydrolase-like [Epargyreus clarus]|uniref:juvenile hormone epoxide hydrolase-like n=1 Tax=Epargyreus clarus TaxID=520877 RepID=UPI003C2C4B94
MAAKPPVTKKDKKKENGESEDIPFYSTSTFMTITTALLIGAVILYFYYMATIPPDVSKIDLNQYWGKYPMDANPDTTIRPYNIEFSEEIVNDLKERLLHRRPFPTPVEGAGFTYGFNTHFLTRVLDYWQNKYDFKHRATFLNKYNHYITKIQGLDIHFMHVQPDISTNAKVVPILLLHGWPGSIREFYELIPKLTTLNPKHKFVFEIIAPSLPGFGFSEAPSRSGMDTVAMAVVMRNLMRRIGFKQYYIHGGDIGYTVGSIMATLFPDNILGFHTNFPVVFHPLGVMYTFLGALWPSLIVEPELQGRMYPLSNHFMYLVEESGYAHLQATKPDTIGIALTDSPAGLAAYILEKFSTWTNPEYKKASDGNLLNKFELTHLLDNVMVYWVSNSITTSMRLYAESTGLKSYEDNYDLIPTNVPTWGIKFKYDFMFSPDCNLRLKYRNYLRTTAVEDGGHFAAMENPEILANDMFEAVQTFMAFHGINDDPPQRNQKKNEIIKSLYGFTVKDIHGNYKDLADYRGYVVLIVNVASECGLTDKNYHQLNLLYEKYADQGLRILAFPCNQFGGQEPGSPTDIIGFTKKRGVKFDIFEKVEVNGENAHPLWKFLKTAKGGTMGDFIKWNFSKFIVNREGEPVERLGPNVDPLDIEPYLAKYL